MAKEIGYLGGRELKKELGVEQHSENRKTLGVIGRVGVGTTSYSPVYDMEVRGDFKPGELVDSSDNKGTLGLYLSKDVDGIKWVQVEPTGLGAIFVTEDDQIVGVSSFTGINFRGGAFVSVSTNTSNTSFVDIDFSEADSREWVEYSTVGIFTTKFVGIGSTQPDTPLDVIGDGNIAGILTAIQFVGPLTGDVVGDLTGTATTAINLEDAANINTGTIDRARLTGDYDIGITGFAQTSGFATTAFTLDGKVEAELVVSFASSSSFATTAFTLDGKLEEELNVAVADTAGYATTSYDLFYSSYAIDITGTATTATNLSDAANITTGTISRDRLTGDYDIGITGLAQTASFATTAFTLDGKVESELNVSVADTAGFATTSFGLQGVPDIEVGLVTATDIDAEDATFSGIVTATGGFVGNVTGTATTATNLADAANITTGTISRDRLTGDYDIGITGLAQTASFATTAFTLDGKLEQELVVSSASTANFATTSFFLDDATGILNGRIDNARLSGSYDIDITGLAATATAAATAGSATTASAADVAYALEGAPNITIGNLIGVAATFSGNVTIGGTLTYEDVNNIDSTGFITARTGIHVGHGVGIGITFLPAGTGTFAGSVDISGDLDVDGLTELDDLNVSGIATFANRIESSNRLYIGDANAQLYRENFNFKLDVAGQHDCDITANSSGGDGGNINLRTVEGGRVKITGTGGVGIYHTDTALKVETTGTGATVFGTLETQQLNVSGVSTFQGNISVPDDTYLYFGDNNEFSISHVASVNAIQSSSVHGIQFRTQKLIINNEQDDETFAEFFSDAEASLYWDSFKKLSTSGAGATVFGTLDAEQLNVSGVTTSVGGFVGDLTGTATTATNLADASGITSGTISRDRLTGDYDIGITGLAQTAGYATTAYGLDGRPDIDVSEINCTRIELSYDTPQSVIITDSQFDIENISPKISGQNVAIEFVADVSNIDYEQGIHWYEGNSDPDARMKLDYNAEDDLPSNGAIEIFGYNLGGSSSPPGLPSGENLLFCVNRYGEVGIGSTRPAGFLDVGGDPTRPSALFNHYVGIGLTQPTTHLQVEGNASFTGVITATTLIGDVTGTASTASFATTAYGLEGTPDLNVGTVTGTSFVGDGSGLTNITATGSGIGVRDDDSVVGTAQTINFGSNLSVTAVSAGIVTITSTGGGGGSVGAAGTWAVTSAGIHTTKNVGVGTTNPQSTLQVERYGVQTGFGTFNAQVGVAYTIDTYDISVTDFKTAEYTLFFEYNNDIQSQKVMIMQNGTTAYAQEWAVMSHTDLIVTATSTLSGNDCKLEIVPETGVSGLTTYRFTRQAML